MTNQKAPSKVLNIALWVIQVILAVSLLMGTVMKFMPIEKVAPIMPWMGQLPKITVRLSGVIDLLGALGLILPALFHIKPILTPWAAIGILLLMICASVFHIARGEASVIGANIVFAIMAAFIAWGRFKKV
jgi:uncharacterized membrane protein